MSTFMLRAHDLAQTDQVIQDGFASRLHTIVDLRLPGIERLRLTPKNVNNGEAPVTLRRDFALLAVDEAYLDRHLPEWETVIEGGRRWLMVSNYALPEGFDVTNVMLAIEIPVAYPSAQLDMFFVAPVLKLPGGAAPAATQARQIIRGTSFQRWSRHRGDQHPWNPAVDNLITHIALVESSLANEVFL